MRHSVFLFTMHRTLWLFEFRVCYPSYQRLRGSMLANHGYSGRYVLPAIVSYPVNRQWYTNVNRTRVNERRGTRGKQGFIGTYVTLRKYYCNLILVLAIFDEQIDHCTD